MRKPTPRRPAAGIAQAITVPTYTFCAAQPVVAPLMAAAGLASVSFLLHRLLWLMTPLSLIMIHRSYRRHRDPKPLIAGLLGFLLIMAHLTTHDHIASGLFGENRLGLIWLGMPLMLTSALLDVLAIRRAGSIAASSAQDYWRAILEEGHPILARGRATLKAIPSSPRCKLCFAPFRGIGGVLMRMIGRGRSRENPSFCESCMRRAQLGGAEVDLTMLFADVRGSTELAEGLTPEQYASTMNRFYKATTEVLIQDDALIDKLVGDEVIALFVPGYAGKDHASKAIDAARRLLEATGHGDRNGPWIPVGIGVHSGRAFVGIVGAEGGVTDLTAMGDPVNVTARLASAAGVGEILVSDDAFNAAGLADPDQERRTLQLKGKSSPLGVRVKKL